jgi:predicted hotdog family 3-hydroxylacyl-ACP dehydratase
VNTNNTIPDVCELLPHGAGMTFIETLEHCQNGHAVARVNLKSLTLFSDEVGRLPSYLGLECMVQTVAAMVGLKRYRNREQPLVGLILGTRRCRFEDANFPSEGILTVEIKTLMMEEPLGVFEGKVLSDERVIVHGQVKAIQPQTESQLNELLAGTL